MSVSHLSHHTHERPYLERLQGYAYKILVEESANEEDRHRGGSLTVTHLYNRNIKMSAT